METLLVHSQTQADFGSLSVDILLSRLPPTPGMDVQLTPKALFPQEVSLLSAQVLLVCKLLLRVT